MEFPEDDIEANKVLTKVPSSYDGHSEELIWQFSAHKDQVPILAICGRYRSDRNVQIFRKVPQKGEYVVDTKSFLPARRQNVQLNLRFIHPFKPVNVANRQSEEVSKKQDGEMKKRETSTAQKPTSSSTPNERNRQLVYSFLMGHATKSEKDSMSTLVVRMDNEGVFQSMHKVYVQNKMLNITYMPFPDQLLLLNSIQLSEVTSQNDNTEKYKTVQCSPQTKTKLKEFIKSKQGPGATAKKTDDTRRKSNREHEKENVKDNLEKTPLMKGAKQKADTTSSSQTTLEAVDDNERDDTSKKSDTTSNRESEKKTDDPSKKSHTTLNREGLTKTYDNGANSQRTSNREGDKKTNNNGVNSKITSNRESDKKTDDNGVNSERTSNRKYDKKTDHNEVNSETTSNREHEKETEENAINSEMASNRKGETKTDYTRDDSEMILDRGGEKQTDDMTDNSKMTSGRGGEKVADVTRDYSEMTSGREGEKQTDDMRDYSEMTLDRERETETDVNAEKSETSSKIGPQKTDVKPDYIADETNTVDSETEIEFNNKKHLQTYESDGDMFSQEESTDPSKREMEWNKDYSKKIANEEIAVHTLKKEYYTEAKTSSPLIDVSYYQQLPINATAMYTMSTTTMNTEETNSQSLPSNATAVSAMSSATINTEETTSQSLLSNATSVSAMSSATINTEETTSQSLLSNATSVSAMLSATIKTEETNSQSLLSDATSVSAMCTGTINTEPRNSQSLPSNATAMSAMSSATMNTEETNSQSLPSNATSVSAMSSATINTEETNSQSLLSNATSVSTMCTGTMNTEPRNYQSLPSNATAMSAMSTTMDLHATNSQSLPTNATAMSTMNTTMDLQASNYQSPDLPGINPLFDLNYTDTLLTNYGVQSTSNTLANANTILYGMSHGQTNSSFTDSNRNYIDEVSQGISNWQIPASNFQSSQELNLGNRIKITISVPPKDLQPHSRIPLDLTIETKMPIEVLQQRPNHQHNIPQDDDKCVQLKSTPTNVHPELTNEDCESVDIQSNTSSKPCISYSSTTTSDTIRKNTETDEEKTQSASENDANSKPYDINLHKHGNYSFTKRPSDKVYGVGKSRYKNEMNRLAPTIGIQQTQNETSFNSTHNKTAMKQKDKLLKSKSRLVGDPRMKSITMNDVLSKSGSKELIHGKLGGMEGYESNSAVDTKGKKEEEKSDPKKYSEMNGGDDEKLHKFRGVHNDVQDEMDEDHQEECNDDEDTEIEDGWNRLGEDENEEESDEQSETCDVNPDENYLQAEDDDDNPQFTSTPKGNINVLKNIKLYCI